MLRDRGDGAVLTVADVNAAHGAAARRLDPIYSQLWLGLSAAQRRALQAIAEEGGAGLFRQVTGERYGLTATAMKRAIEGLMTKQVCWRRLRSGTTELRLEDPLLGRWVRDTIAAPRQQR